MQVVRPFVLYLGMKEFKLLKRFNSLLFLYDTKWSFIRFPSPYFVLTRLPTEEVGGIFEQGKRTELAD